MIIYTFNLLATVRMLVYIEGNIGTGKTTFLNMLNYYLKEFESLDLDARIVLEPVDEWMDTKDSDGNNILQKFYKNQERYSYIFQMNSFISRVKKINDEFERDDYKYVYKNSVEDSVEDSEVIKPERHNAIEDSWGDMDTDDTDDEMPELESASPKMEKLLFVERSIYTDKNCFAENCFESGNMSKLEYDVYCKWNEWLSSEFRVRPDAYIYLRCFPNVNHDRISKRNREGEENIPLEYLQVLHEKHEKWMAKEKETVPILTIDALLNFKDPEVMAKIAEEIYYFVRYKINLL
jgi:deoxyadenosine/deoxycytidine kinase